MADIGQIGRGDLIGMATVTTTAFGIASYLRRRIRPLGLDLSEGSRRLSRMVEKENSLDLECEYEYQLERFMREIENC